VTLTETVQEPPAGIVPPVKARLFPPGTAVAAPPVQVVATPGDAAFTSPLT
jgi:hypothetical protein